MSEIKVSKFFVTIPGDESVGIFDQQWTLEPDFYFEGEKELDDFKENILQAFEKAFGEKTHIETAEELEAQMAVDLIMSEQMLADMDSDFEDEDVSPRKMKKLMDDDFNFNGK